MAIDILSIPCMSATVERLFSSSKLTITDQRNRLEVEQLEHAEYLKSWRNLVSHNVPNIGVVSVPWSEVDRLDSCGKCYVGSCLCD